MHLRSSLTRLLLATSMVMAMFPGRAAAQSTYGAVVGVLTDASDAVVPGVTVTLTEVQTNVVRTTITGGRGNYEFLNLVQGRYRIEAELAGFQKAVVSPFPVGARETVRINVALSAAPRLGRGDGQGGGAPHQHREPDGRGGRRQPAPAGAALHLPDLQYLARRHDRGPAQVQKGTASTSRSPAARPTRTRCQSTASPA
jgi:hypothetical protein